MKSLLALGVTRINDSYPNVKYKLGMLSRIFGDQYVDAVVAIDGGQNFSAAGPRGWFSRLGLALRMLLAHLRAFYRSATHRADAVYVCYPGIVIAAWLGLPFIRSRYRAIYLDAFISLYDTVIHDRRLLKPGQLAAKLLFALERRALATATTVIVDTPENADHYASLFNLPAARFQVVPLSIPPLVPIGVAPKPAANSPLRCIFVGTFVPLQGVPVIVEAIRLLSDEPGIEFVFVGDGQDAGCLDAYIESRSAKNVTWHRGHFPTDFVAEQIQRADVCLGVFGDAEKTQRVLPYKLYYYLALAMPVVTSSGATSERILAECARQEESAPLSVVPAGDAVSLANALGRFRDDRSGLAALGRAGRQYYEDALSEPVVARHLQTLFELTEIGNG
ncbi:MAG: glycosyltransferase [Gammaproteobacteria bacterium]|nr:glycosyltransferase [Gammaproteobacteria bacterium]